MGGAEEVRRWEEGLVERTCATLAPAAGLWRAHRREPLLCRRTVPPSDSVRYSHWQREWGVGEGGGKSLGAHLPFPPASPPLPPAPPPQRAAAALLAP